MRCQQRCLASRSSHLSEKSQCAVAVRPANTSVLLTSRTTSTDAGLMPPFSPSCCIADVLRLIAPLANALTLPACSAGAKAVPPCFVQNLRPAFLAGFFCLECLQLFRMMTSAKGLAALLPETDNGLNCPLAPLLWHFREKLIYKLNH